MKEDRLKRPHDIWFRLHDVLEKVKLLRQKNCSVLAKGWGKARDWLDYNNVHICQNGRTVHHNGWNWYPSFEKQNKKNICLCDKIIFEKEMIKFRLLVIYWKDKMRQDRKEP